MWGNKKLLPLPTLSMYGSALRCMPSLEQFHQRFTCNFYLGRSQKRKKDSQLKQLFVLTGSVSVKATCKHVDEIYPSLKLPNFAAIQYYALPHILVQSSLRQLWKGQDKKVEFETCKFEIDMIEIVDSDQVKFETFKSS